MSRTLAHHSPAEGWRSPRPRWIRPFEHEVVLGKPEAVKLEPEIAAWFEAAIAKADEEHPPTPGSYEDKHRT